MLQQLGAFIGILAAIAWFVAAVLSIPAFVPQEGGRDQWDSDVARWMFAVTRYLGLAGYWNAVAALLTGVSIGLESFH
jgi:hypothetical protein